MSEDSDATGERTDSPCGRFHAPDFGVGKDTWHRPTFDTVGIPAGSSGRSLPAVATGAPISHHACSACGHRRLARG